MSKSSRDVGKTKKLKQTTMGNFFSIPATSSKKKHKNSKGKMTFWGSSSARDTEDYRERYPDKKDHEELDANVRFYKNELESKPDGALIEDILKNWWGDYKLLEKHHGYIQWLFPIREDGMNWHAQELQKHEIEKICEDKEAHARVLKAYKMMLNFYGMKLENDESGKIERAENWEDRFNHLNKSFHNYLRITRILKCLGELGYEQLKKPFIEFILHEAMVTKTLPNLLNSCYNYWINVLRDDDERIDMWNLYTVYEQTTESSDEENIESKKKPKMNNDSEKDPQSADLKDNKNGTDTEMEPVEPKQEDNNKQSCPMDNPDVIMEVDSESNESIEKPKMKMFKVEPKNNDKSADLNASVDEKVTEQDVSSQEGNIEKLTQVDDSYQLLKEGDESNEDGKKLKMKVDSENDSVNFITSASKEVIEGEALTQVGSVEKVYNPDMFMEAEYQQVGDNDVTSRHHEQNNSEIDGEINISETPVLSKSESVEMIDDSQRCSFNQDKQIDSETPVTRDEQQASLSKKDSVTHDNHSDNEQNREECQENSCGEKLEAKLDVEANGKLEKDSSLTGNFGEASDVVKKA